MKRYYFNIKKYNDILDKYYSMSFKSIDFNFDTDDNWIDDWEIETDNKSINIK